MYHCHRSFFIIKQPIYDNCNNLCGLNTCFCYPIPTAIIDLPNRINSLSPKAFITYQQTIKAQNNGYDMLVGAGLRIALEWLVWDYLIKVKHFSEEELKHLSLAKRIEKNGFKFLYWCLH